MINRPAPDMRHPTTADATDRNLTEKEVWQRSDRYFQSLIENSLDGICVLDGDGMIQYESRSIERIVGYSPDERRGKSVFDLVHPDDLPRITGAFRDLLQTEGATVHMEVRLVHRDGSHRFVEATCQNLLDDPSVRSVVLNLRDITDREKAERRYRMLTDNLSDVI